MSGKPDVVDTMDKWLRAPDVFSDIVTYEENVGEIGEVDERILDAIEASHEEIENDVHEDRAPEEREEVTPAPFKGKRRTHRGMRKKKRPRDERPEKPEVDLDPIEENGRNIIGT